MELLVFFFLLFFFSLIIFDRRLACSKLITRKMDASQRILVSKFLLIIKLEDDSRTTRSFREFTSILSVSRKGRIKKKGKKGKISLPLNRNIKTLVILE